MISPKTVIGVVIVAILIGVVYVSFEKNFSGNKSISTSQSSSAQELSKNNFPQNSSVINLPGPEATLTPISEGSDLQSEASNLQMRDYSSYFEDLKKKAQE
ncbi:hypothetical protein HYW44_02930 [Candidatus Daviesbacteria bacterium]|nr:hypothetical protein [Candidatus Daviesbacteria bacterium]